MTTRCRNASREANGAGWLSALALVLAACSPSPEPSVEPGGGQGGSASAPGGGGGGAVASGGSGGQAGTGGSVITKIGTQRYGRRGIGCTVKNDCAAGLSCIQGVCQPSSFGLTPTGKECVQIDCTASEDCCGGLPSVVPEKCKARASTCTQQLPGCVTRACTRASDCGGGGACVGKCSVTKGECRGNVDCLANKCLEGKCSLNFTACASDAECAPNVCSGGSCACQNPNYSPTSPVCADSECDDLCLWACEESRCVIPSTCGADAECFGSRPLCVAGKCVECTVGTDCSFDKICVDGTCQTPCESDAQCGLFEACQAGECVYVGCRSHRDCTLVPDVRSIGLAPGIDPRLLRCHTEDGVGRCLIPCQTDSQCATTEVCSGGLCKYIGCESNEECSTILGLHQQVAQSEQPWVSEVECRAADE